MRSYNINITISRKDISENPAMLERKNTESHNLIATDELIQKAVSAGVKFGYGDPKNRIRYLIKTGLLPHQIRKHIDGKIVPYIPEYALERLLEIQQMQDEKNFKIPQIVDFYIQQRDDSQPQGKVSESKTTKTTAAPLTSDVTYITSSTLAGKDDKTEGSRSKKFYPLGFFSKPKLAINSYLNKDDNLVSLSRSKYRSRAIFIGVALLLLLGVGYQYAETVENSPLAKSVMAWINEYEEDQFARLNEGNDKDQLVYDPTSINPELKITIPTQFDNIVEFNDDVFLNGANLYIDDGQIQASNLVYSITAGPGIAIVGDQEITVTNTDLGSSQDIFKIFAFDEIEISADSNNSQLTVRSAGGITFEEDGDGIVISSVVPDEYTWITSINGSEQDVIEAGMSVDFVSGNDIAVTSGGSNILSFDIESVIDTVTQINIPSGGGISIGGV